MNSNYNFFKIRFISVFKKPKSTPNSLFKALSLLVMVSLFSINNSYGQCLQPSPFGTSALSTELNGSGTIFCNFGGEYGIWDGAITGNTYTFSSTIATDFITISEVPGGPALAWGTQPLVYTSTVTGTLYVHVSTDSACGTEENCRNITGTTTGIFIPGCTNVVAYGTRTLSAVLNGFETIGCSFAGEYSTWNAAVTGNTYTFTSTIATDYLTIHSGAANGPIVASGTQPLAWTSNTTGTIYVHVNTNSACGTESSCRDITGTTTAIFTGCTNVSPYGTGALSPLVSGSGTIVCNFGGEYGTWNDAITGNTYTFTSTIATDYLTIHTGTPDGPVVAFGLQPLSWVSNTTGTIYVHVNNDSACGIQNSCRNITGTTDALLGISVLTPSTGSNSITCGQTATLCTHAGCGSLYDNGVDGHTIINAANSAVVNINGTYNTEEDFDYITIYTGSGTGGAIAFGPVSGTGTINFTGTPGQTYTIRFTSDISIPSTGYNLAVTYTGSCTPPTILVPFSGDNSIACGVNSTLCSHAGCGLSYDNNADGFTVLNALGTATVTINGSYETESGFDYITIYEGSGTGGTILFGPVSGSGTINYTGSIGQTLTLRFSSDSSIFNTGFSFAITYAGNCSITTIPNCLASPTAPVNGSTISPCGVTLSWPSEDLAESYDVYLDTGAGPATTLVAAAQTGTSYSTGLLAGATSYSWRVVPKNALGDAVGCSDFTFTTTAIPAAPTGLACYQTATFNATTCVWDVTGTQPIMPSNINATIAGGCQPISGEWVNSGLLNGYYDFQYVFNGETYHISFDGVQWVLWVVNFTNNGFTNSSPSNGLYPPTTGWILTGCGDGTLSLDYTISPPLACNESYVFNDETCVWDIVTGPPCESVVNLKLFVEGYYTGTSTMASVKNNQDGVSPIDEVEDITVNLHRDSAPFDVLHTTTATLKTDGTAVCSFATAPSGSFYIAVTNSNAIETWSATPQTVGPTPLAYDFSTAANKAYEDNMIDVGAGVFAFFSGDINQDDVIDGSDATDLDLDIFNSEFGVRITDLNGDGSVDGSDATYFENNQFNSVFAHYPQ